MGEEFEAGRSCDILSGLSVDSLERDIKGLGGILVTQDSTQLQGNVYI